jgi:hypothetical protein
MGGLALWSMFSGPNFWELTEKRKKSIVFNFIPYLLTYSMVQNPQAKMQWMQDPSQSNVDNLNNVRRDASRHFRNKRRHI